MSLGDGNAAVKDDVRQVVSRSVLLGLLAELGVPILWARSFCRLRPNSILLGPSANDFLDGTPT